MNLPPRPGMVRARSTTSGVIGLAACAATTLMPVARGFGLAFEGLQLIPGLELVSVEGHHNVLVFGAVHKHHDAARERQRVDNLSLSTRCHNPFVALGELLARL